MSTTSPPPDYTPSTVSPTSNSAPPIPDSPSPPVSTPIQPNADPPGTSPPPPAQSSPPQSPPSAVPSAPPPSNVSPPPPTSTTPPVAPTTSPPPPPVDSTPPPITSTSPPPPSDPPQISPPPPTPTPPESSPPPPPPTPKPPESSPPPPSVDPPKNSPPPPSVDPPKNSPPPPTPTSTPPQSSPSPPSPKSPQKSPPSPALKPPESSPPPPVATPPKVSPPPPNSTVISSPPPPFSSLTPPVLSPPSSPSPPSPFQASPPPGELVSPSSGGGQISTGAVVAISAVLGLTVLSLAGLLVWCMVKRKRKASGFNVGYIMPSPYGGSSPNSDSSFLKAPNSSAPLIGSGSGSAVSSPGLGNSRPWFTYEELYVATNGFSDENLLGEGGFGCVYKGHLPDGREVAVKQLKVGGGQGEREFKAEVETISRIHHRHLVSLVGYCISDSRRLLIYEFVPNDTLYFHLHGKDNPVMDWDRRVKVAAGAARGVAYLHEDCHPRIIHRDIKSSNILLGANFEARVSDFGLAKLAADADTHITTRVMGTFGYMAPEYASSGKLTEKSDVYSFGVVLLEMITGRKPVDASQPLGDESLVEWARPLLSDALENEQFDSIADPRLEKNYVGSEMFRMVEAAAACVRHSAAKRPRMSQVVRALDSVASSDLSNGMKPGQSEVYDPAQQSAEIRLFQRMAFGSQNYSIDSFSQTSMNNNH